MDIIHARFAGRDVHKQTVVACVRVAAASRARPRCGRLPVAVAASMLTAADYMLRDAQDCRDLGAAHFQPSTTPASSPLLPAASTTLARSPSTPPHDPHTERVTW